MFDSRVTIPIRFRTMAPLHVGSGEEDDWVDPPPAKPIAAAW